MLFIIKYLYIKFGGNMEENKPIMPPPPKELKNMPPPPPQRSQVSAQEEQAAPVIVSSEPKEQQETIQATEKDIKQGELAVAKEERKEKHKPSGGVKTALYWTGFAVSLIAFGILLYLLIR